MNHIRDKKRWWAANFCTPHIKCADNSFFGLGLGVGLVSCLIMALVLVAIIPHGHIIGFGGILLSDSLKQTRATKAEEAQKIYTDADTAKRAPTADEKKTFDSLMAEVDAFTARIEAQLKIEAVTTDVPKPPKDAARPKVGNDDRRPVISFPRNKKLKAFTREFAGRSADENAYRSGKWAQAVLMGNAKAMAYCQENGVFAWGTDRVMYNLQEEGVNTTGGFLVPTEFEQSIIDLREEYGVARRFCEIDTMSSDYQVQPRRTGGLTAYPVAESAAFTESAKNWDQITLTAKKWGVLAKYSTELGEDAVINIADDLASEAAYAFAVAEDGCLFNGDGTSTYAGITGILAKFQNATPPTMKGAVIVQTLTHDLFSEIDADDIDAMIGTLPLYAQRNARFYMSPMAKALVMDPILRAAGGNTQGDISQKMPPRYLGYPIEQAVAMPTGTGSFDDKVMLLFGDMAAAVEMGVRRGVTLQILNELYAANGQIGLIASERFDINVHDVGNTTTAGPLVALIGSVS